MACSHPLSAIVVGKLPSGKADLKIRPLWVKSISIDSRGQWRDEATENPSYPGMRKYFNDRVEIPCGKCIGCRLEYSKQWANRCMLEAQYHESSYFVTLTYDDEHVPIRYTVDPATGEATPAMSLVKRDFQLFMKRLRKQTGQKIRFFMAGEYGSKTFRPHYHAILFGLKLDDLQLWKTSKLNDPYYNSAAITRAWSVYDETKGSIAPLGFAVVAPVTWETCAYTARYTAKKSGTQDAKFFEQMNIEPPFTLMSRKPGIAAQYYADHKEHLYDGLYINLSTDSGGRKFRPPRYFDHLYDVDYPEKSEVLKTARKEMMRHVQELKARSTTLTEEDWHEVEERALIARTKSLVRDL